MKKLLFLSLLFSIVPFMACDDEEDVYKRPAYEPYRAICGIENGRENIAWIRDTIQIEKDRFKEDKTMLFFEIYKAELNGNDVVLFMAPSDVLYYTHAYSCQGELLDLTQDEHDYLIENHSSWSCLFDVSDYTQ
ncbi:MAG TPA: hypothetical protein H9848_08740 [Candidatus Parabacteroides intestinigallinarum]|uniref:Lipoprotein n=1 Tax=Candidatus Parabacteroides intestinigallinarum TaxID=2838722 RepID=A0A9D1XS75_9BACT|nr:hypothetical protein [Candidatus Parabacteroides intestinigallinarum]